METTSIVPDTKLLKAGFKKEAFDKEFRLLTKQAQETILARYGVSIDAGENRVELICLNRYLNIYNQMTPEEHYAYFENVFNKHRLAILNTLTDTKWLKNDKIIIQFGEGIKGFSEKYKQIRLYISAIYQIACDLQTMAEKTLDGIDEQFVGKSDDRDLIRPNILLLHLMRIFYHLNDGTDKPALGEIVIALENELGVAHKTVGAEPWLNGKTETPSAITSEAGSGVSAIFKLAIDLMGNMGIKPPEGIKPPSDAEINSVITNVFNHDVTKNAMKTMVSAVNGKEDLGSAVQSVMQNITKPETINALKDSLSQTAQIARDGVQTEKPVENLQN